MKIPLRSLLVPLLLLFAAVALPGVVHAQATKIFVASFGNDANDGSRGSPKRNFQPAHDAVAAGGQIVVLDTAGYGALTITKSLAVTVPPGVNGFLTLTNAGDGIAVNAPATAVVSLRGLVIEGIGANGGFGIFATSVGTLRVEDCTVRGFSNGIYLFSPISARLLVRGVSVRDVTYGIIVGTRITNVTMVGVVTDCTVDNALSVAILANSAGSGTAVNMTVSNCVLTNSAYAMETAGIGSFIVADACTISNNTYGFYKRNDLGTIYTRGNNTFAYTTLINSPNATTSLGGF